MHFGQQMGFRDIEMQGEGAWWNGSGSGVCGEHCPAPSPGQYSVPSNRKSGRVQGKSGRGSSFLPSGQNVSD